MCFTPTFYGTQIIFLFPHCLAFPLSSTPKMQAAYYFCVWAARSQSVLHDLFEAQQTTFCTNTNAVTFGTKRTHSLERKGMYIWTERKFAERNS